MLFFRFPGPCIYAGLIGLLLACARVHALPPHLNLDQLDHTQWTVRDGAPSGTGGLTQTADGYLWKGSHKGLYRFDGVQFERVRGAGGQQLLSDAVYAVWAPPEGGLWIGYTFGGVSLLKDGRLTHYFEAEGLPRASVSGFAKDGAGTLWVATTRGLFRFADGRWSAGGEAWNVPRQATWALQLDRQGVMWALMDGALMSLQPAAQRFELAARFEPDLAIDLVRSRDGDVWFAERQGPEIMVMRNFIAGRRMLTLDLRGHISADEHIKRAFLDRQGFLWLTTGSGVRRVHPASPGSDELRWDDPPSGKAVTLNSPGYLEIVEDREGNLWFSTDGGLEKLRAPMLAKAPLPAGRAMFPMAATVDGIWIGAGAEQQLFKVSRSEVLGVPGPRLPYSWVGFDNMYRDPQGELWIAAAETLWHLQNGSWQASKRPSEQRSPSNPLSIQTMTMDASGAMWVSVVRSGVYRVVGDVWTERGGYTELPQEAATVLTADDRGRVWFGYMGNRVSMLTGDRVRHLDATDGPSMGSVLAIATRGDRVWVGGERGLASFDGRALRALTGDIDFTMISGIAEMPNGDLWMNTADGAIHIVASELDRWRANHAYRVSCKLLDGLDGMPGTPVSLRPMPTIAVGHDGLVWFSTVTGVVWTDPTLRSSNAVIPPVHIKRLRADGVVHETAASGVPLRLPSRTRNLQISYTALSLTIPERVRFKYQLQGLDPTWQEAGTRREAFYNDLPPGDYRFRVIASNNDGLWNETGASLAFAIPPTFIQTRWFTALWVGASVALLFLGFAWWLRRAKRQLRLRFEERMTERERIARELHDTLLQGVQGLILQLQTVVDHGSMHDDARRSMTEALDRADALLVEGRDRVKDLRSASTAPASLRLALLEAAEQMAGGHQAKLRVLESGARRELHPMVREEAARIAIEAMFNSLRHAQAATIEIDVAYERRQLRINVRDDGQGMEETVLRGGREGHFGFMGMHERAKRIGGQISVWSRPGAGTEVSLTVPAGMAYVPRGSAWRTSKAVDQSPPYQG